MTIVHDQAGIVVHHAKNLDVLRELPDASVDSVVTDPPYGLEFMGKEWDSFRVDDPGTNRHRGENAGDHGDIAKVNTTNPAAGTVAYGGGKRAKTSRCVGCGKRDQFRKAHGCPEDTRWAAEILDPHAAPPTMLAFQEWAREWALECYRVLKPGGHLLAFGGTRTWHRLAAGVEDAGFELRDSIAWMYGSGFPKSHDVSKAIDKAAGATREQVRVEATEVRNPKATGGGRDGTEGATRPWIEAALENGYHEKDSDEPVTEEARTWQGWGTALKPAFEPIVVARKPLAGTVAANVLANGTGALNIAACRVGTEGGRKDPGVDSRSPESVSAYGHGLNGRSSELVPGMGRWPANVVLDESQAAELDEQSGVLSSGANPTRRGADAGGASRFYYTAKAGADERVKLDGVAHPTVKPLSLMRWLVRLVTPPGGVVLEPFAGSGTTAEACLLEGFGCVAIEREAEYLPLIVQRMNRRLDPVAAVRTTGGDGGLFDLLDEAAGA